MSANAILGPAALAGMVTVLIGSSSLSAEPFVYVPLGAHGTIAVIDADTGSVIESIAGVPAVHGLAATPDGRLLIAGSYTEREAGSAMPEKPADVSADDHAAHHAASPADDSRGAFVSTVSIIRSADGLVVRRTDVPGAVHHVAVTGDGGFAVATQPKAGAISLVDLADYRLASVVKTGPMANYAVADSSGARLFVSNAGNDTVSEVDTRHWIVRRNFLVGASPEHIVLSHDGRRLYVANAQAGTVSEIALGTGAITRTFEVGGKLHGLDLSDDGRTLFVAAAEESRLVGIDLHTLKQRSIPLAPSPEHVTTVTGTGKLYVSSGESPKIWVIDAQTLGVVAEIPVAGEGHQMAVVP